MAKVVSKKHVGYKRTCSRIRTSSNNTRFRPSFAGVGVSSNYVLIHVLTAWQSSMAAACVCTPIALLCVISFRRALKTPTRRKCVALKLRRRCMWIVANALVIVVLLLFAQRCMIATFAFIARYATYTLRTALFWLTN